MGTVSPCFTLKRFLPTGYLLSRTRLSGRSSTHHCDEKGWEKPAKWPVKMDVVSASRHVEEQSSLAPFMHLFPSNRARILVAEVDCQSLGQRYIDNHVLLYIEVWNWEVKEPNYWISIVDDPLLFSRTRTKENGVNEISGKCRNCQRVKCPVGKH